MLICEELYLLLTRENGEPEEPAAPAYFLGHGLTAGLAADLVIAGRIEVTTDRPARVRVLSTLQTGQRVINWGLERIQPRDGRTLSSTLRQRRFNPKAEVIESLSQATVLQFSGRTALGFGPRRVTQRTPEPKQRIRDRLARVFAGEAVPSSGDLAILATLKSLGAAPRLLGELSGSQSRADLAERVDALVATAQPPIAALTRAFAEMPNLAPHRGAATPLRGSGNAAASAGSF